MRTRTAKLCFLRLIRSRAAATFISPAIARLLVAGPRGRATTSPRSTSRRNWNNRVAHRRRTNRNNCCVSSVSARRTWHRTVSAALAKMNFGPTGRHRRGARSRRHAGRIRRPATRHAVRPLHAGDDHPWTLASRRTAGLYRGPRARTRHGYRPVLRAVADALREVCQLTGVEYDPITARIARLVHPEAHVRCEDYARSQLSGVSIS